MTAVNTHPMEHPDTGLPISAAGMRRRVFNLVGDDMAVQVLGELAYWAWRCAEVKDAGGDKEGSDKALWMWAVLREPEEDQ